MSEFIFAEDPNLGQVVEDYEVFCSWASNRPIKNIAEVTGDVCGHKFSKICGFNFKSNATNAAAKKFPIFQIVYCPKTRSNFARNDRSLHGWYIWQHRSSDDKMILSIHDLLAIYNFDIAKFFQSDVFNKYAPIFRRQIMNAYDKQVVPFIETIEGEQSTVLPGNLNVTYTKRDAEFLAKNVFDSAQKIEDVLKFNVDTPDVKKAKVAYNADKTYSLNMKNTLNTYDGNGDHTAGKMHESIGFPEYKFNTVDDFENFFKAAQDDSDLYDNGLGDDFENYGKPTGKYDKLDTEHVVFTDKNGKVLKIVDAKVLNNGINFTLD